MPRLAVITSYFPVPQQPMRGVSAYQTLRRMTGDFDLHVFMASQRYPAWLPPRNFPYVRVDKSYRPEGVPVTYFEYPALPVLSRPINGHSIVRTVWPAVRSFQPDIILNYGVFPEGQAAVAVGRRLGVPVVVGSLGSDLNRIPGSLQRHLTRRVLRQADALLTVSDQLRRQGIAMGASPARARAIHNGCDTTLFHLRDRQAARAQLGLGQKARLLLFVGWINFTKGIRELGEAFLSLAPADPRLELALVGTGPEAAELRRTCEAAGLGGRLHLPGAQPPALVAEWLGAADIFCLPSYMEGCPNVVVEALASGRPVVASEVGGIPELVDTPLKGILHAPRSAPALRQALETALAREWDAPAIVRACSRDWTVAAVETTAFLHEILAAR